MSGLISKKYISTIKSPSAAQMSKSTKQTQSVDKIRYTCINIHSHTYIHTQINTHIYVHIHACMCIHTSIYTYIFHSMIQRQ